MKVSELQKSSNFKLLQFSEPGAGKTFRAMSALAYGPVYVIDTDNKFGGLVPRLEAAYGKDVINSQVDVDTPKSAADFTAIMTNLAKKAESFSTVVLDTQSRAFDMVLDAVKAANPKGDGRQIFGAALERNIAYLNRFLSLPCNIIINAHVGAEEMADGTSKLTSTTPGKFGKKMTEYFNEVHYLYLNTTNQHRVRGEPSASVVARTVVNKDQLDNLGVFKLTDLSIFNDIAYRTKGIGGL